MIIAIVLSTVTPSTVKIRLRSECSFFGRTAAIAMAADAPQIATAPPVRSAKRHPRLNSRAPSIPNRMVRTTPAATKQRTPNPRLAISSTLIRIPRSATPKRRTPFALTAIPGTQRPSSARKWKTIPSTGSFGSRLFEDGERLVAMFGEVLLALDRTVPPASMDGEGGVSQGGEGLGGVARSGAAGVLAAGPIADVVQAVASRPEEFHPRPLTERCGSLSAHPAPTKQPVGIRVGCRTASLPPRSPPVASWTLTTTAWPNPFAPAA